MKTLDANLIQIMRDPMCGPDLHRVLTALCANSGNSYMSEYETLQRVMVDGLHGNEGATIRDAIRARDDVKVDKVEMDITTLEAGHKAAGRVREQAVRLLDQLPVDDHGRVRLLDQGGLVDMRPVGIPPAQTPTGTPDGGMTLTPASFETVCNQPLLSSRLHRARTLTGHYQGPEGAQDWRQADVAYAEAGLDLLGGLERDHQIAVADSRAQAVAGQLDAAFQQGGSPKERRKLMEKAAAPMLRMLEGS